MHAAGVYILFPFVESRFFCCKMYLTRDMYVVEWVAEQ